MEVKSYKDLMHNEVDNTPLVSSINEGKGFFDYRYRYSLLSSPSEESFIGRMSFAIAARTRRDVLKRIMYTKLKPMKDFTHDWLEKVYDLTVETAKLHFEDIGDNMSWETFFEGFQAKGWNSTCKYVTIFDVLTDCVEFWHRYYLGVISIQNKDDWIDITGSKLKWPKNRYSNKEGQDYDRSPLYVRRHLPFQSADHFDKILKDDAGVFKLINKQTPDCVTKIHRR